MGFGRALVAAAVLLFSGFVIVGHAGSLGVSPYHGFLIGMVVQGPGLGLGGDGDQSAHQCALCGGSRTAGFPSCMPGIRPVRGGGSLIGIFGDQAGLFLAADVCAAGIALHCLRRDGAEVEKFPDVGLSTDAPVTPGEMIRATLHSPTIFLWVVLMMFTASTEFAPGKWVDVALSQIVGMRGILLLAYVSGLMFVMRHFAGPLVKRLSNVGLLIFSAAFATVGLYRLSCGTRSGQALIAATGWGFGVCYFWPTMLATVAERYPRSGTMVFGLMGSAGALSTYVVLPALGDDL